MNNISMIFNASELALAAYANLTPGVTDNPIRQAALVAAGLSAKQAEEFAKKYPEILTQYTDTPAEGGLGTSFSATVFKDTTGNLTLAIRGTAELVGTPNDILPSDTDIALAGASFDQIVALWNWWQRVSHATGTLVPQYHLTGTPTNPGQAVFIQSSLGQWLEPIASVAATGTLVAALGADSDYQLDVTGHSLGGHLAMAFGSLFPSATNQITVFNAPGFKNTATVQTFFNHLDGNIPNGVDTTNVIADEASVGSVPWSAIAGLHSRPGVAVNIPVENQWLSDEPNPADAINHSQQTLTDALAVYSLLTELAPSLSSMAFKSILAATASGTAAVLEKIVDVLERTFGVNTANLATGNANRDALYQAIYGLQQNALFQQDAGFVQIQSLAGLNRDQIVAYAKTDIAYRYALEELNQFTVTGDAGLYVQHNADGHLDAGQVSDLYLQDRAAMLSWLLQFNVNDNAPTATPYGDTFYILGSFGDRYYFEDVATNTKIRLGETVDLLQPPTDFRHIVFGGGQGEILNGSATSDHLYGGAGDDTLTGHQGNDHLEGGAGQDTYVITPGDGFDTVLDSDGSGAVVIGGIQANGKAAVMSASDWLQLSTNTWQDRENGLNYQLIAQADGTQDLYLIGSHGSTRIRNWHGGDLGISLGMGGIAAIPGYGLTLTGDLAPIDQDEGAPGIQFGYDALDNALVGATFEPGRADTLYDSAGDDLIRGLGGNDILYAWRGGADRLEGGDGDDILDAGPGADLATGNAGQDLVWGLAGADVLYGGDEQALDAALLAGETQVGSGQKGDLLGGGGDNDSLIGDAGNDALAGGAGGDLLIGGGGDDNLMGDEDLTNANLGWSLTRNVISDANGNTQYQRLYNNVDAAESANGGADILYGGAGNDWLLGQMGDDILDGGSGDDVLFGGAGGDVLLGQAGDDLLIGDDASAPADQQGDGYLDGGDGDDTLKGGIGADQLIGGDGDDTLFAFDGDDHLDGGAGQDWLIGDDLSVAGAQHGADTLDGGDDDDYLFGQGGGDRLQGGQGNDYLQGDDGALVGEYHGNDSLYGGAGNDTLLGDGGHDTLDGGDGDDSLFGDNHPSQPLAEEFQGNDILNGGAGLDYLEGGAGDDVYRFKAGDSPLIGGTAESVNDSKGHDHIEFGAGVGAGNIHLYQYGQDMALQYGGNDWLWIYGGFTGAVESFGFDNGAKMSWMQLIGLAYGSVVNSSTGSANATLSGGNQNDSLTATGGGSSFSGGKGNDTLAGAGGGNTYLYNLGDGSDTIQDTGGQTDAQGNSVPNVLSFGEGITADDISLGLGSLLIRVGSDPNDTIRIANFNPDDVLGQRAIDRFAFADGTVLSYEDLLARGFDLAGTAGNDTITGTNIQDRISGGAGNDTLSGGAGDDRLAGASGNDILSGGAGSDTYEFNLGDGVDTLSEVAASADTDVLVFGSGINPSDISAMRNGDDLEFRHANGGDKVVVANWFLGSTGFYQLDRVEFADGTQWLATNISQMLANSPPTGSVTLSGTAAQGQVLTAGNSLADADGLGAIGYQWQTSADGTTWDNLAGATGASFTLSEVQVGEQLRVVASYTDGQGKAEAAASAASAVVANVNDAPIASPPLANQVATQGQVFSFTVPVDAFTDPDQAHGDALNYTATQVDGSALPAWLSFNPVTKTFSGTPANGDVGALSLQVTATDLGGLAASQTFDLAVANLNDAPSLSVPLADQLAHAGSAFTFQMPANTFADIDMGDALAYHATRADGTALPPWLTFDPVTRTFSGTPGATDVGQFDARVVATDTGGLTAFDVFALAIDQDAMTGTPGDDNLVGTAGDDTLTGGAGNDVLDGGAGADLLLADAGDDGFLMSALDGAWAKGYGVLNDGSPGHAGSGQVIAIAGRKANHDVMDGGDGWDTLTGTGFDDVIVLDDRFSPTALSGPRFMNIEQFAGGGGNDIIDLTSQLYVYGDVTLDGGDGKDVLWAGSGNDRLIGGAGNDVLDGGYGADTMIGGLGSDTYTVDNPGDVVTENAGQGTDTVKSSVTHTLGDNVEKLVLTGGAATNGTGNPLNNTLTGNGGANTLDGGAGNDILQGGKGNDTYLFYRGGGVDTWIENDATVGNVDVGRFGLDILHDQIWFLRKGNNLEMSAIGTSDKAVLRDWYLGGARHLERFEAGDGRVLLDGQVDALVQAMAAFTPPAAGQTSLPANYHDALAPVLAANWQ